MLAAGRRRMINSFVNLRVADIQACYELRTGRATRRMLGCGKALTYAYISRRPSMAFHMVTSSANSMSLPTGIPMAIRVTFTPSGFSSFDK